MLSRNKVVLTEVGAGVMYYFLKLFINTSLQKKSNPSLIGRVVVFETIGIGSNPMGFIIFIKNL